MNETLLGHLQAPDLIRKEQVESPYTLTNQIASQTQVVREYADKRYAVQMYSDMLSLSPQYKEKAMEDASNRLVEIKEKLRSSESSKRVISRKSGLEVYSTRGEKQTYSSGKSSIDLLA